MLNKDIRNMFKGNIYITVVDGGSFNQLVNTFDYNDDIYNGEIVENEAPEEGPYEQYSFNNCVYVCDFNIANTRDTSSCIGAEILTASSGDGIVKIAITNPYDDVYITLNSEVIK